MGKIVFFPLKQLLGAERWELLKKDKYSRIVPSGAAATVFTFGGGVMGCDANGDLFWGGVDPQLEKIFSSFWEKITTFGKVVALDVRGREVAVLQRSGNSSSRLTILMIEEIEADPIPVMNSILGREPRRFFVRRFSFRVDDSVDDVFFLGGKDIGNHKLLVVRGGVTASVVELTKLADHYADDSSNEESSHWEGFITFNSLG